MSNCVSSDWVCVCVCVRAHSKRLHCPFSLLFRASKFRVFGLVVEQSVPLSLRHEATSSAATTTKTNQTNSHRQINDKNKTCDRGGVSEWNIYTSLVIDNSFFPIVKLNKTLMWNVYEFLWMNSFYLYAHMQMTNVTSINVFICRYAQKKREHATSDNAHRQGKKMFNVRKQAQFHIHIICIWAASYYHPKNK